MLSPWNVLRWVTASLKNAIDFVCREWNNKAAGFVSYGSAGGVRAVEHLRLVMAEVQVATVRNQVALPLFTDFENYTTFKPAVHQEKAVNQMLNQLIAWILGDEPYTTLPTFASASFLSLWTSCCEESVFAVAAA